VECVFGVVAFRTPPFSRKEAAMQGVHAFDPKVKTSIDLESFVAEDHALRRIDRILDLSFRGPM
jgi:hypothetical protein